jgi:uncharacterized protein (DUF58 family)
MLLADAASEASSWVAAAPWLFMVLVAFPLIFAAWKSRTFPTALLVGLMFVPIFLGLVTVVFPTMLVGVLFVDAFIIVMAAADYFILPSKRGAAKGLLVERSIPRTVSINIATDTEFTLLNRTGRTFIGSVKDDMPEHFTAKPQSHDLHLPPLAKVTFRRKVTGDRRGAFQFEKTYVKTRSVLRLWRRQFVIKLESRVNVYPDMKQLSEYAILARTDRLSLIGVRKTRRVGQDSEFERLRDYSADDNYRHIDWRTTARRNKLTVRQFQSDQSQRVIFLLDCGRMMTNERNGMSLLDHSLNSALMMSYVALAQGDAVGMLCFSDTIHSYIPPRGGKNQLNRLLQAGFDQFPRLVESRYDQAFLHLSNHCKRRTLVVFMTNLIDEVNAGQVVDYLGNLVGRHLPLGVLLRDRQMFDAADHPTENPDQLYRSAVAAEILCWRDQVIRDIRHRGSLVLDVFPDEMTAPLVNQYLQVKAQHLL